MFERAKITRSHITNSVFTAMRISAVPLTLSPSRKCNYIHQSSLCPAQRHTLHQTWLDRLLQLLRLLRPISAAHLGLPRSHFQQRLAGFHLWIQAELHNRGYSARRSGSVQLQCSQHRHSPGSQQEHTAACIL